MSRASRCHEVQTGEPGWGPGRREPVPGLWAAFQVEEELFPMLVPQEQRGPARAGVRKPRWNEAHTPEAKTSPSSLSASEQRKCFGAAGGERTALPPFVGVAFVSPAHGVGWAHQTKWKDFDSMVREEACWA